MKMNFIDSEGFFKDFYIKVQTECNENLIKKFSNLKTDEARFAFVHNLESVKELKLESDTSGGKDLQTALDLKQNGNTAFQNRNYKQALNLYNKSYLLTPNENVEELSVILANRSAALYHIEQYDLALRDIELAAKNYPKQWMYKIAERKARCHLANKKFEMAFEAFKETVTSLDDAKIPMENRQKLSKDAQIMIKMLMKQVEMEKTLKKVSKKTKSNETVYELNGNTTFDSNEREGRFAKAKTDIKVGDRILTEKPNCFMLLEKYCKTHCHHCFIRIAAPIACSNCTNIIFCSTQCKGSAMVSYHKYECQILPILWRSGSSINCHMALRLIAQKPIRYFHNLKENFTKTILPHDLKKLKHDDYLKVYGLERHEKTRGFTSFLQYTIMAYFLTECLKIGKYFGDTIDDKAYNFVGGLILRNLQFLQFNTHEIYELQKSVDGQTAKTVFIGGGIYPVLALFNHSCDPGIVRYYKGTSVYAYAIKNIPKGAVIAENYGPLYSQNPKVERQTNLKDLYWFDCNCEPCMENWPLYDEMIETELRFKCDGVPGCKNVITIPIDCNEFMIKCVVCGEFTNILKGLKAVQDTELIQKTAGRLVQEGDHVKALHKYMEMLKIMDDAMVPPFKDFCNCQQNIKDCLLEFGSNYTVPSN